MLNIAYTLYLSIFFFNFSDFLKWKCGNHVRNIKHLSATFLHFQTELADGGVLVPALRVILLIYPSTHPTSLMPMFLRDTDNFLMTNHKHLGQTAHNAHC